MHAIFKFSFAHNITIELCLSNIGIGQDKSGEKLEAHEKFAEPREVEVRFPFSFIVQECFQPLFLKLKCLSRYPSY
jgi:hypothetical protein